MIAIDTNIVVRYLTGDHPEQSPRARSIIDGQSVFVTVTVLLESEWVLRSAYNYSRTETIHALRAFCGLPTVSTEDADAVAMALDLSQKGVDFGDALHVTRAAHCERFVTFDRRFIKAACAAGHQAIGEA